jgi:uncharacterized protein YyaL (SSP411 family)
MAVLHPTASALRATLLLLVLAAPAGADERLEFLPWEPATFERARGEGRILAVTVTTTWCHWCHVMIDDTWNEPRVRARIAARYLPVRVDGDARPDLAERFRNYRWPATAFLTPEGEPILALRGHRYPEKFLEVLAWVEDAVSRGGPFPGFDQPPEPDVRTPPADRAALEALRERLRAQLDRAWDLRQGGWGSPQKYPIWHPVEHGLLFGAGDEARDRGRAFAALKVYEGLLDPVWGGMYQYSTHGVWSRPHFEKIVPVNAGNLGAYADAHRLTRDPRWLAAAEAILRWVRAFLRAPSGAFYASQDADGPGGMAGERYFALGDRERRRLGLPRVDARLHAAENGMLIGALCRLHAATDRRTTLDEAAFAARAILATHRAPGGGVLHAPGDATLYLLDQAVFGRALLLLARETGRREWVDEALEIAQAMEDRLFDRRRGGFRDATDDPAGAPGALGRPLVSLETNAEAARFLLLLEAFTGEPRLGERARSAIASVAAPEVVAAHGRNVGGLLLAAEEALSPWIRLDVRGPAGDPRTASLRTAARAAARGEPRAALIEEEPATGPPEPPAVLVCGAAWCSDPVTDPAFLADAFRRAAGGE